MRSLDEVRAELADIQERLIQLPDDAFGERLELKSRQEELRAEAAQLRSRVPETRKELEEELAALERQLDRLFQEHVDVVGQAGGSDAGDFGFTADAFHINKQIDQAGGREGLQDRIAEIRRRLEELDDGPP
ncbi:MAG: hypothetical protein M3N51_05325 [Actinomycetota bacterium]|nr:hypothetical protein [Actinomycetota bacterium]